MKRRFMFTATIAFFFSFFFSFFVTASAIHAAADDFTAARDLYAAAEYEGALRLLDHLRRGDQAASDTRAIEQYRAFCLLALGRASDAEQAIAAVVSSDPSYRPSDAEVSPRVRSAFSAVRRRMLPRLVQERYAAGKWAFDQKQFATAAKEFKHVLSVLADPDVAPYADQPPLADVRTLSAGFLDLAVNAATPPPPPVPSSPPPTPVLDPVPEPPPPMVRIYSASDPDVVPPRAIRQILPPFPASVVLASQGVLEVVIDETGAVEHAAMRAPVSARYDRVAVQATRQWQYEPAMVNGVPVKYRKMIQIAVKR